MRLNVVYAKCVLKTIPTYPSQAMKPQRLSYRLILYQTAVKGQLLEQYLHRPCDIRPILVEVCHRIS